MIILVVVWAAWFSYHKFYKQSEYQPEYKNEEPKEIEVLLPAPGTTTVDTEFVIYGKGRAFENTLNYRISDGSGKELYLGSMMTDAPDAGIFGYFREEIDL